MLKVILGIVLVAVVLIVGTILVDALFDITLGTLFRRKTKPQTENVYPFKRRGE